MAKGDFFRAALGCGILVLAAVAIVNKEPDAKQLAAMTRCDNVADSLDRAISCQALQLDYNVEYQKSMAELKEIYGSKPRPCKLAISEAHRMGFSDTDLVRMHRRTSEIGVYYYWKETYGVEFCNSRLVKEFGDVVRSIGAQE